MRHGGYPFIAFVLLVASLQPALAQDKAGWSVDDDPDDQAVDSILPVPAAATWPANGATSHGDLRRITIEGETPLGLWVNFFVGPFKVELDPSFSFSFRCARFSGSSSSGSDGIEALS